MLLGKFENKQLNFFGKLDETDEAKNIADTIEDAGKQLSAKTITIDFSGTTGANSVGVSTWVKTLQSLSVTIKYVNMPEWLAEQMNMIPALATQMASVDSVLAPYYSEDTNDIVFQKIDTSDLPRLQEKIASGALETIEIDGKSFEADFDPSDYFYFLIEGLEEFSKAQ